MKASSQDRLSIPKSAPLLAPVQNEDSHVTKRDLITSLNVYALLSMKSADVLACAHGIGVSTLVGKLEKGAL